LLEAITELNRYLDKPATLAHPGLHYRTLSANFSLVDPKSVLEAIALSEGLTLEAQHHQWLLSDAPVR
jgi:ferric-dicitrate binding protein FerR (iron transport regulator)